MTSTWNCCEVLSPKPADVIIHLEPGASRSAAQGVWIQGREISKQIPIFHHNRWLQTVQNTSYSVPATLMSYNVFCSCGGSVWTLQINLPHYQCLLDKTWHIGFKFSFSIWFLLLSKFDGWSTMICYPNFYTILYHWDNTFKITTVLFNCSAGTVL